MTPSFEKVRTVLKGLPGLGYRSAERLALHLLVERPERLQELVAQLTEAAQKIKRCPVTGDLCEAERSEICLNPGRNPAQVCVVESVSELVAFENSEAYRGWYHVLHGKLSPIQGVGPEHLFFDPLVQRIEAGEVSEIILALSNDVEGEATCHYIQEHLVGDRPIEITRIGFGLPSGAGVTYADGATLKSALEGRRKMI